VSIIGAGVVGTTLACLADRAGYPVVAIASRRVESAHRACGELGKDVAKSDPIEAARLGQVVLITTSDSAIAEVCESLARAGAFQPGAVVAHCSGALSSEVLSPAARRCGASIASIHPLQTFPSVADAIRHFPGTWCFCEGGEPAVTILRDLFTKMGARVERIDTPSKVLYHAAGVMACNYVVTLLDAAGELARRAGIEPSWVLTALRPLVTATIDNVTRTGPAGALTGPIVRGDVNVVEQHLAEIERVSPELADLYRRLGRRTLSIVRSKSTLDDVVIERLRGALR